MALLLVAGLLAASAARADLRREAQPNDTAAAARPLVPAASVGGTIDPAGDVDFVALAVAAGQTIKADLLARGFRAGSQPGSELSAVLEILDPDGVTVLASDQSLGDFDDPSVQHTAASAGRYLISVRDLAPGEGGPGYRYVLSVEIDSNDTAGDATPIRAPVLPSIDALIFPAGDRDVYAVPGAAGDILTVDIDSAVFNPANPPAKIVLTLLDPAETVVTQDAYTASDPEDPFLQVELPADGTYLIDVRELRSFVGTTNTFYQMTVEIGPAPGNDSFADATPVALPRSVSGVVSPAGDADHFRFQLGAPATFHADLDAAEDLLSLLAGTLTIEDAGGLLASDSSTPDPLLTGPLPAGDFSVGVEGACTGGGCVEEDSYYVLHLDPDGDGDGLVLPEDNCPSAPNPLQVDGDGDGAGDLCDNCVGLFNPDQADSDGDGLGDLCQACLPAEAAGLLFLNGQDLAWSGAGPGVTFNLYRGTFGTGPWQYDEACLLPGLPVPGASDPEDPVAGGFTYIVSTVNICGEGPLGTDSAGSPRPVPPPCP